MPNITLLHKRTSKNVYKTIPHPSLTHHVLHLLATTAPLAPPPYTPSIGKATRLLRWLINEKGFLISIQEKGGMPPRDQRDRDRERDPLVVGRVVGDVLDPFTRTISLRVSYVSRDVANGCELKPSQVVTQPRVDIGGDDLRIFYTLASSETNTPYLYIYIWAAVIMVDPDAPSPSSPNLREYLHWYALPVTPSPCHTYTWQEIVCYESPRPMAGIHRFIFILFRQLGRQTVYAPGWRQNFNTREFAELYNLGLPVASVYFNCQRESTSGGARRR
ncbi:hypothetical protein SAY87_010082 [Trapa incisa]|uniref:Uncharacterized protein n=1 Tax=Trapa incisa TaxID=236973 RepID=A0AAN7JHV3_9MYRT|nr:hypothetical protein SAY87_010082 [Trapa incisa]